MRANEEIQAALRYHQGTKHPNGPLLDPYHRYHPGQRPLLFKRYRDVEQVKLDVDPQAVDQPALRAIAQSGVAPDEREIPEVGDLASLLFLSAGITKRIHYRGHGEMYFRAASCTGALYHIELYLACGDLPGLEAGLYHFDPAGMALDILRRGDYRSLLVDASAGQEDLKHAPAILIYTDVFYRNACKYQTREYRHAYWDSGTILSHTLSVANSQGLPHRLVMGYEDASVNQFLGLDTEEEVSLALVSLGRTPDQPPPAPDLPPLALETVPIADHVKTFPEILQIHQASSLTSPEGVAAWRTGPFSLEEEPVQGDLIPLDPHLGEDVPDDPLGSVIRRRGSSREFAREPISFQELSTLLASSTGGYPADFSGGGGLSQNEVYLIVHAVEGLQSGSYLYRRDQGGLELLQGGDFRGESRHLALDQALGGDCAVAVYFLTDLEEVLERYGNRGYRTAEMDASITAGKMYLAAYAQSLGATGLTFYDDQVTAFFSPHAAGKSVMFLIAVGVPA